MNKKRNTRHRRPVKKVLSTIAFLLPMAAMANDPIILYHELDGTGAITRSIALDGDMCELIGALLPIAVFISIVWFVMGGDEK